MSYPKRVLITGASTGIGKALTLECLRRGMMVVAVARNGEKLEQMATECLQGGYKNLQTMACDVSCAQAIEDLFTSLGTQGLIIHVFFLNAGLAGAAAVEISGFDLEKHREIFDVNYFGVLNMVDAWWKNYAGNPNNVLGKKISPQEDLEDSCTHSRDHPLRSEVSPPQSSSSHISGDLHPLPSPPVHFVVTSSVNALWAPPGGSAYAASKAAISKAFEGLSVSLFGHARFFSLYCGPVGSEGLKGSFPFTWSVEKMAHYMADFAMGKKRRVYPSLFYGVVCWVLRRLPQGWIVHWFGKKKSDARP